jgi:uncharacterized glyoxalase superfamily protein PhnB
VAHEPFHSVTPRVFVDDPGSLIEFLRAVFDAQGEQLGDRPTDVTIGDSIVMVSGTAEREPQTACLYVYVDDADAAFTKALRAGAVALEPPANQPYGDRRAMFQDPAGNLYQVAHRLHRA